MFLNAVGVAFFMKFLVTRTIQEGYEFDCLFEYHKDTVKRIDPLFAEHDLVSTKTDLPVVDLPTEIVMKIITNVIIARLKTHNYGLVMPLVAINTFMAHRIYYALFGAGRESALVKFKRLSKVIQILASIYDDYMIAEKCQQDQTLVLDYDGSWVLSVNHVFYPWDLKAEISVIGVHHIQNHGYTLSLGPWYGDQALAYGPYEKDGVFYCRALAFPYLHILVMNHFRFLSVFQDPVTQYYFGRFSMLLRALYGKYCRVFFFTKSVPISDDEVETELDAIFQQGYYFEEIPKCVRK
jgi:hypothetical protein